MSENYGFTDRAIAKLQRASILDGPFAMSLNHYLMSKGRITYDAKRDLFWAHPTSGHPQVAVWMMPLLVERK